MADEKVIGSGVGGLNTGDSGINDGTAGVGGGGATGGGTTGTSGTSGVATTLGTSGDQDPSSAETVQSVVSAYLAISAIGITYDTLVKKYVENKLGFSKLKEDYKKANPDIDPKEIDEQVDKAKEDAIEEFNPKDGSTTASKEELEGKFKELQSVTAEIRKNMNSIVSEFSKTVAEAFMPTTIGLGAPNPVSISLKLFNGITKLKRILDRLFAALATFMALAKSLGLESEPFYTTIMDVLAQPINTVQNLINRQEADPQYQENVALATYIEEAKKNWPHGITNDIDYKEIEAMGREGIAVKKGTLVINTWPMSVDDRKALQSWRDKWDNTGGYDSYIDKWDLILKYNDYLTWATKEFKKNYEVVKKAEEGTQN